MSDLSNLLGDLYGDSQDPDGMPVRREPAASDRVAAPSGRVDDDLAAALSAALGDMSPAATAPVDEPVPAPMPEALAVPAPVAPAPSMPDLPAAPRASWTSAPAPAAPAPMPAMPAAPVSVATPPAPRLWDRGDDDIFPAVGAVRSRKKR